MSAPLVILSLVGLAAAASAGCAVHRASSRRNRWRPPATGAIRGASFHASHPVTYKKGVVYYRTKDGQANYAFSIKRQSGGQYRIFIESQPSYAGRDTSLHATHRLRDGSRHYVCWDGPLRTEQDVRQVAALWADNTQRYIRTGRRF